MTTSTVLISGDWEIPAGPADSDLYCFAFEATAVMTETPRGYRPTRFYATGQIVEAIAARQILLQTHDGFEYQQIVRDGDGFLLPDYMDSGDHWMLPDEAMLAETGQTLYDLSATGICWYSLDETDRVIYPIRNTDIKEI